MVTTVGYCYHLLIWVGIMIIYSKHNAISYSYVYMYISRI